MSIYSVLGSFYPGYEKTGIARKTSGKQEVSGQSASRKRAPGKRDSMEISLDAYEMQTKDGKMYASSGKDALGISKGAGEGSFIIHFSDSAMISRTIARGYVTVNGIEIVLPDSVKKRLAAVDKEAQKNREAAYNRYIMEYDVGVMKQQLETRREAAQDMADAMEIAARLMKGEKVSSMDIKKLMKVNPQLYAAAMVLRNMSDKQEKQKERKTVSQEQRTKEEAAEGVSWSDYEWTSYETQMHVSIKGIPSVGDIQMSSLSIGN